MNEEKNFVEFSDLFEETKENNNYNEQVKNKNPFIFAILSYFVVFFLISTILQLLFLKNPASLETLTGTESTIELISETPGVSFAAIEDFNNSFNRYDVDYVVYGSYVVIYTKGLDADETFLNSIYFDSDEDLKLFFEKKATYLKINNLDNSEFLTNFDLDKALFDHELDTTRQFKSGVSTTINFIVYVIATAIVGFFLYKVFLSDLSRFSKKAKLIISIIVVGYLYMILGNIIGKTITSLIRLITNTKDSISVNQFAINKMLRSSYAPLMIIPVVLFAPIVEELVFRKSFFAIIKNDKIALVVSSLLFGLIHVIGETGVDFIVNLISYSIPGVMLGLFYIKNDKNILAPMIAHAVSNLISVLLILLIL